MYKNCVEEKMCAVCMHMHMYITTWMFSCAHARKMLSDSDIRFF